MNRELILAIVTAILIPLCPAQQKTPEEMAKAAAAARQKDHETAIQMNELAGHIRNQYWRAPRVPAIRRANHEDHAVVRDVAQRQ